MQNYNLIILLIPQLLHHANMLGPGARAPTQLHQPCPGGASYPVQPAGGALHQPECQLREPGAAQAVPVSPG